MKRLWALKPNLMDCVLEDRICPIIANLGIIALTTSGLTLSTPFPGASNSLSSTSVASSAASVSGAAFPSSFYVTGRSGISSFAPGNFTGNPVVGGAGGTASAFSVTITVGSGADEANGSPANTATPSRTNSGNGSLNPVLATIGGTSSSGGSGSQSDGQSNGGQGAPVPAASPFGMTLPPQIMGGQGGSMPSPLNPGAGAPTMTPGSGLIRMPAPVFPGLSTGGMSLPSGN